MSMIQPIPGFIPGAAQPSAAAAGVKAPSKAQRPGDGAQGRSQKPVMDEYTPEEPHEPAGLYWRGKDGDGQPKIYFDDPERAADAPEKRDELPGAGSHGQDGGTDSPVKRASGRKAELCTCSTDQVDREIKQLKKKQEELERQIHSQADDAKVKELEQKLAKVESELGQKDNDAYRRRHAVFS